MTPSVRADRPGRKGAMQVHQIHTVMGVDPETWLKTKDFDSGQTIYPDEKLQLVTGPRDIAMRVIDLACPIGKGAFMTGVHCWRPNASVSSSCFTSISSSRYLTVCPPSDNS